MFISNSLLKDPFSKLKEPSAPKIFLGILEGHQYLVPIKLFRKCGDLNVHFICEHDRQVVKAMHMECNGEYQIG